MYRRLLPVMGLAGALALSACADAVTEPLATSFAAAAPEQPTAVRAPAPGTAPIAAVAIEAGFNELVGALTYVDEELDAGLVELFLNGKGQHTVFAPTNQAFEELYTLLSAVLGTPVDEITDIPAPVVLDVLLYHVAEGRRAANSVVPRQGERSITPLLREGFAVRADGSIRDGLTGLRSDAAITAADIAASNGIIHVIDAVIVPPSVVAALTR